MADEQKLKLKDVLNYAPEDYLTDIEKSWIRTTFAGSQVGVNILRKLLLPSAFDPALPIEQMGGDLWMVDYNFAQIPYEEAKSIMLARQDAVKFVVGGLIKLKVIANQKEETPQEKNARRAQDSSK